MDTQTTPDALYSTSSTLALCSEFSFEALAALYNETRVDYIVPMPMNARRMIEYVRDYDVDLSNSMVILDEQGQPAGLGMLGLRSHRAWITRLGISPKARGKRYGEILMRELIRRACEYKVDSVQLEVIKGNEPARTLFMKVGFVPTRELLILNRPPSTPAPTIKTPLELRPLNHNECVERLHNTPLPDASWIDEGQSLINSGQLAGLEAEAESTPSWVIFRQSRFQISHFVLHTDPLRQDALATALISGVHKSFPALDAKIENIPLDSPYLNIFHSLGYIEVFRRIEMRLTFS